METYTLKMTVTFECTVDVCAENEDEAVAIAEENFKVGGIGEINHNNCDQIEDWDVPFHPASIVFEA